MQYRAGVCIFSYSLSAFELTKFVVIINPIVIPPCKGRVTTKSSCTALHVLRYVPDSAVCVVCIYIQGYMNTVSVSHSV